MIDIKNFTDLETKGLVSLVRLSDDALAISSKHFNSTTGEEESETVEGDSISAHKAKVVELQKQIDEENAFIEKVELLKAQN